MKCFNVVALLMISVTANAVGLKSQDPKYHYLFNACDSVYSDTLKVLDSQSIAANMQMGCLLGTKDGLNENKKQQREAAEIIAEYAPNAEDGTGDPKAMFMVAMWKMYLKYYERAHQVAH